MISHARSGPTNLTACTIVATLLALAISPGVDSSQNDAAFKSSLADAPTFQMAGKGGSMLADARDAKGDGSPSIRLFQSGKKISELPSVCVRWKSNGRHRPSLPTNLGSTIRLSFRHSIYQSQVEEMFLIRAEGFELTQLRYGDARLVEFYGHERATNENGNWIVEPAPALLSALNLSISGDAAMSLHFAATDRAQAFTLEPNSSTRLTVDSCPEYGNG